VIQTPEGLQFKEPRMELEWQNEAISPLLRTVIVFLVERRLELVHRQTVVTGIWRTRAENKALGSGSMTHPEWRAIDLRAEWQVLPMEMEIRNAINKKFPTGHDKMPRVPPLDHGTGLHYHIQISRAEASKPRI